MNGLTQTCAALRRRIAELERENRVLQKVNDGVSTAAVSGTVAGEREGGQDSSYPRRFSGRKGAKPSSSQDGMVLMSPSGGLVLDSRDVSEATADSSVDEGG